MEDLEDDFGDIYADVEVQPSSAINGVSDFARMYTDSEEFKNNERSNNAMEVDNDSNLKVGLVDHKKTDSVCLESEEACQEADGRREWNNEDAGSDDSEDDLNIVLNDDDCKAFCNVIGTGVGGSGQNDGVGFEEDGGNIAVKEGSELMGKNKMRGGDQLGERCELLASDGYGFESKSGGNGGYCSRYARHKYARPYRLASTKNLRPNKYADAAVNQMGLHYGGFSLPWYRTIVDVDVDTFPEKPWRTPGVDPTDFFNFDFTEETWKEYCISMSMGRAIQVEDGSGERQPSIDVPSKHERDSDVVIVINVQDSSVDCSMPKNVSTSMTSETKDCHSGGTEDAYSSGSSQEDVLEESIGDEVKLDDSSNEERCTPRKTVYTPSRDRGSLGVGLIPGCSDHEEQNEKVNSPEGKREVLFELKREEGFTRDRFSTNSQTIESEISLSERCCLSLSSSCFISDSEASEDSVQINHNKSHDSLRKPSLNSGNKPKESMGSDEKIVDGKMGRIHKKSKRKDPIGHLQKLCNSGSGIKEHNENYDAVSPILEANFTSNFGHESLDYNSQERVPVYFHVRKPYYRKSVLSYHYIDKVDGHNYALPISPGHLCGKSHKFRESVSPYIWEDREGCYYKHRHSVACDRKSPVVYDEREMDQCYAEISPPLKRDSKLFYERDVCRKRQYEQPPPRKQTSFDDRCWFDDYENDFIIDNHVESTSLADRKKNWLHDRHDRKLPYVRKELSGSGRRDRHRGSPLDLGRYYGDSEYVYWRHRDSWVSWNEHNRDSSSSYEANKHNFKTKRNYVRNTRLTKQHWDYERQLNTGKVGVIGRYCCTDVSGFQDDANHYDDRHWLWSRSSQQSKLHNFTQEDFVLKHEDGWLDEEAKSFYDRTLSHERYEERYGFIHDDNMNVDDIEYRQNQLKMIRGGTAGFIDKSPQIIFDGKLVQSKQIHQGSVDLLLRKRKSFARSSRVRTIGRHDRLGNINLMNAEKQAAMLSAKEFREEREIESELLQKEIFRQNKGKSDNFSLRFDKDDFSSEEGRIVTEKPSYEVSVSRRNVSNCQALTHSIKKRMVSQRSSSSDDCGNADIRGSQRILEALAKMEKRRRRFKEPVTVKKEADKKTEPYVDVVVEAGDIKQSRPARKRRWCGS